jgi:hypothetical protein
VGPAKTAVRGAGEDAPYTGKETGLGLKKSQTRVAGRNTPRSSRIGVRAKAHDPFGLSLFAGLPDTAVWHRRLQTPVTKPPSRCISWQDAGETTFSVPAAPDHFSWMDAP